MRPASDLPAVDSRLVEPGCGYEILDGTLVAVPPADEAHAERHSKVFALLEAFVTEDYNVACDMLTRTSEIDDIAPDASVYPRARDPQSGGRRLEELAFEIVSTEELSATARRARKLSDRGVRRVFAVDVPQRRVFEWSSDAATWQALPDGAAIEDRTLVARLPVEALVKAPHVDDFVARALIAKRNPVVMEAIERARQQGRDEARRQRELEAAREVLVTVIVTQGWSLTRPQRDRIAACTDLLQLLQWMIRAASADDVEHVFEPDVDV